LRRPRTQTSPYELRLGSGHAQATRRGKALVSAFTVPERQGDRGSSDGDDTYDFHLSTPRVAARYGCTVRTVERWALDARLRFPKPDLVVHTRKYWRLSTLQKWERERVTAGAS
jgi:hypothetical protein